jgi:hypothetical protein
MNEMYFKRVRRILACNITELTSEAAAELIDLINKKAKANADSKTKVKPRSGGGDSGAAA